MTQEESAEHTQQPIFYVDGTPDSDYPIRILEAYRQDCDCRFSESSTEEEPTNPLLKLMNQHCEERARILDKAIAVLKKEVKK